MQRFVRLLTDSREKSQTEMDTQAGTTGEKKKLIANQISKFVMWYVSEKNSTPWKNFFIKKFSKIEFIKSKKYW